MKVLDRYFLQQVSAIAIFAIIIFTIAWLAPETMFKVIQGISEGKITVPQGLTYLVYQVPTVLNYCIPISALFASVFFMRQISLSSELIAILGSGISFRRLLVPIGMVGLGLTMLFFLTQEILGPWAATNLRVFNRLTHFDTQEIADPQVVFLEKNPHGSLNKFLIISPYAHDAQNQFIFLFYEGEGEETHLSRIITATKGHWEPKQVAWHLHDGIEYLLNSEGIYSHVHAFNDEIVETSPIANALLSFPNGSPAEFNVKDLERYVRLLSGGGQTEDAKFYRIRLYQRYILPWICVMFALFGTYIGVERSRATRNLGLTYAAILLLLYNILVPVSTTLGNIGIFPAFIAACLPLIIAFFGGTVILQMRKSLG